MDDEDLYPPEIPGNEAPEPEDSPAAQACIAMVEDQAARFGWTLGMRRVTRSERWGVILRADFAMDGTAPAFGVNRMVCWQQPDGRTGLGQSIGTDLPPL